MSTGLHPNDSSGFSYVAVPFRDYSRGYRRRLRAGLTDCGCVLDALAQVIAR
jgi:hypothetical protein